MWRLELCWFQWDCYGSLTGLVGYQFFKIISVSAPSPPSTSVGYCMSGFCLQWLLHAVAFACFGSHSGAPLHHVRTQWTAQAWRWLLQLLGHVDAYRQVHKLQSMFCGSGSMDTALTLRAQQLCENRGGRPEIPVPNSPSCLCGRKATLEEEEALATKAPRL